MKKTNPYILIFVTVLFIYAIVAGYAVKGDGLDEIKDPDAKTQSAKQNTSQGNPSIMTQPSKPALPGQTSESPSASNEEGENAPIEEEAFQKLAPTTVMSFEELVGDNGDYSNVKTYPPAGMYQLEVNLYYQVITAFKENSKGEYAIPVRYMICSTGRVQDPTPTGTFKMGQQRSRFSKFETFNVYGQYWSQITRNIFFHSVLYTSRNAKTYTSSSYKNLGKRVSHGCIRMLVPDARWIYYYGAPGTVVKIIKGKKDAAMEKIKKKLTRAKLPAKRPDLKKGKIPVTEPWPGYNGPITQNYAKNP